MSESFDPQAFRKVWDRVESAGTNAAPSAVGEAERMRNFMDDEASDARTWRALASRATGRDARCLFTRFANEEARHLRRLRGAYYLLTGETYTPKLEPVPQGNMLDILRARYAGELTGAEAYRAAAADTRDARLRALYTENAADETRHAEGVESLIAGML